MPPPILNSLKRWLRPPPVDVRSGRFVAAWTPKHYDGLAARAEFLAEMTGMPVRKLAASSTGA